MMYPMTGRRRTAHGAFIRRSIAWWIDWRLSICRGMKDPHSWRFFHMSFGSPVNTALDEGATKPFIIVWDDSCSVSQSSVSVQRSATAHLLTLDAILNVVRLKTQHMLMIYQTGCLANYNLGIRSLTLSCHVVHIDCCIIHILLTGVS